ncbi:transporter [Vagococcus sp. PNs007]|uniref:Transporter n=1 Tax=Vagococcus proximus TaxID=2991417 RepID=A0ABT5X300_9ENTE|nr:AEC family transporter [Vagococcus proximus]MDF0480374.1 transporter [Vagococcus proximus]
MLTILINAFGLFLIIIAGFTIKRIGLVDKKDGQILSKIILNLTLPATIIIGLNPIKVTGEFLNLTGAAIFINLILVLFAKKIWKKKEEYHRILFMYCITGYNIGNFTLPFIQSFYPEASAYLFMFDVGNCIMLAGGTKMIVSSTFNENDTTTGFSTLVTTLKGSVPFITYIVMLLIRSLDLTLPLGAISILQLFSSANGFLSLLMIGIYLELVLPKKESVIVKKILFWRYSIGAILAAFIFFVIPLPNDLLRLVLTLICFAPIATFSVINSVEAGIEESVAGFISSISILISLALMTIVMMLTL